jgi:dihydroorotase
MLALGIPLEHVVAMATVNSARMVGMQDVIGTLRPGAGADVTVLNDERGRWVLQDNEGTQVVTDRMLTPAFCLRAGERFDAAAPILPVPLAA